MGRPACVVAHIWRPELLYPTRLSASKATWSRSCLAFFAYGQHVGASPMRACMPALRPWAKSRAGIGAASRHRFLGRLHLPVCYCKQAHACESSPRWWWKLTFLATEMRWMQALAMVFRVAYLIFFLSEPQDFCLCFFLSADGLPVQVPEGESALQDRLSTAAGAGSRDRD